MKNNKTSKLVLKNIFLLIPLIIYAIYKNGYLIYEKDLINFFNIFKSVYLIIIGLVIKIIIDIIKNKSIKFDYNFVYVILIGMIMPYNINLFIYTLLFTIIYIAALFLEKFFKFNKVCFIYLLIILIHFIFNEFTFKSILELNYSYSFNFLDLLMGRSIGGISSTSILFSLIAYTVLINDFYYKKDIPLIINITYLFLAIIYFVITNNSNLLLNSELIFCSIFISSLPEYSPYKNRYQYIYSVSIGILSFILSLLINSIISVYIATFIVSLLQNINIRQKITKTRLE